MLLMLSPLCGGVAFPSEGNIEKARTVDGEMLVKWEDTYYFDTESQPFTGRALSKFEDGTTRYDATIVNGKPHGEVTIFHDNGNKLFSASYAKGIQQGIEYNWHQNGTLQFSVNYEKGQRHGKMTSWREDGSRQMDIFFTNGKIHGPFIVYDEEETISSHRIYHDGKLTFTRKSSDSKLITSATQIGPGLYTDIINKEKYTSGQYNNPGYPKKANSEDILSLFLTSEKKTNSTSYIWVNDNISLPFNLEMEYLAKPRRGSVVQFGYSALAIHFNAQNKTNDPPKFSETTGIIPSTGGYAIQLNTNKRRKSVMLYNPLGKSVEKINYNPTTNSTWNKLTLKVDEDRIQMTINEDEVIQYDSPQFVSETGMVAISAANGKHSALHAIRNLKIESVGTPQKKSNQPNVVSSEEVLNEHEIKVRTIGFNHLIKKEDNLHYELGQNKPFTGKIIDYYELGIIKLETHFENGVMHGSHSLWYPDGSISVQTEYTKGKPAVKIQFDEEKTQSP